MPTYEYECDACQHAFEEFQSFSEKVLKKFPKCKKSKLRRLFGTGSAILFKGSGFYETDYRSESYKSSASADKESAAKSEPAAKKDSTPTPTPTPSTDSKSNAAAPKPSKPSPKKD